MAWRVVYTKQAAKDAKKLALSGLRANAERILEILSGNPYQSPPFFEKLTGDLQGTYSRRINIQHRLAYQVFDEQHTVKVLRFWAHYE